MKVLTHSLNRKPSLQGGGAHRLWSLRLLAIVALAAALLVSTAGDANATSHERLSNGSFENGSTDWVFDNVDLVGDWDAHEGSNLVDLNAFSPGEISQEFPTASGGDYTVTFYMAGNPQCGSGTKTLTASAGSFSQNYAHDVGGDTTGSLTWEEISFSFVADDVTSTLKFEGSSPSNACGPLVDDVSVTGPPPLPPLPTTKGQCKKGGWESFGVFKNQGDCVSFVATDGHNQPAG